MLLGSHRRPGVYDPALRRDHIGDPLGVAIDEGHRRVIGLHDPAARIGGHGEATAAFADRESLEGVDVVAGDADHRGVQGFVLRRGLREGVGFDGASLGECLGIEVEDDRSLLQGVAEDEPERLPGEGGIGLECRGCIAWLELGGSGLCNDSCRERGQRRGYLSES